ncbi:MAG: hypothetical protein MMC33_001046 [Icmadophila ericetorum]|nr:hypothetical protein [Icmadophila ericetorum]
MSTPSTINGESTPAPETLSMAEQLQQKHAASSGHTPTVEEVPDEDDILHPPPSSLPGSTPSDLATTPVLTSVDAALSEKALGKQKAQEPAEAFSTIQTQNGNVRLDTKSEELFPSLGSGTKLRGSSQISSTWGANKPASVSHKVPNGINGHSPSPTTTTSRSGTPKPGAMRPVSANISAPALARGPGQPLSMPGRHVDKVQIQFQPSQLRPRQEMRKPIPELIREINKKSKAQVEMKPGAGGVIYLIGQGPPDAVRKALQDLGKDIGSKQSVRIPVPASIRPHLIGKQGSKIREIQAKSGAQVKIPKSEENTQPQGEDDEDAMIEIVIEGDALSAEMARQEIEAIINERPSNINMKLRDIPAEFFPFIAGPNNRHVNALEEGRNLKVNVPPYYVWSGQAPPQPSPSDAPVRFMPHPTNHIHLQGERNAVQEAKIQIEHQVEELRKQLALEQMAIERGRHQFISGEDGASLQDFLEETGCTVFFPPRSEDTEMLTIAGPADRIRAGIEKVENLASSMASSSIDFSRQHPNAPLGPQAHARALTRYLQQRQAIAELEELHNSRIYVPTSEEGPMNWEVYSIDGKNTMRARTDIMNIINAHPPARLRHVPMDPFYHQHLHEQYSNNLKDDFGVHMVLPDGFAVDEPVLLIYEGPNRDAASFELPRQRPSASEAAQFEAALQRAQEHIMSLFAKEQSIAITHVEFPLKYHEKVKKYVHREQQNLPAGVIPVQVLDASLVDLAHPQRLHLRGPKDRVDGLVESLARFAEALRQDELERGYTTSFDFPPKFANYLIGKKGENINNLREEFDVDIQLNDGKVEIKGPKAKAEACKSRILSMSKKLEDEVTHILKIKPQFHREMIGAKGSQVNRLQERYNVRVQFPRSASNGHDNDSVGDNASEAGGARGHRSNQAPDEVIIRGPKKGADEARDELLSLLQWTVDNSHSSVVSVAKSQLPSLIGQGGKEMESIRETTGAKIEVPDRDEVDKNGRVDIKIKGTKTQVDAAKKLLEQRAKEFDESTAVTMTVDKKYHKALIGSGGANIRNIVLQAGGSDDRREIARTVRFPRAESNETTIRVEGKKAVVDKIVATIEAFVSERENQITEVMEINPEKHRLLIGQGGETRRALESQFGISLDIPKQSQQGAARSHVKLSGRPENIQKAKEHILEMTKEQQGETIHIPRHLHYVISDNGLIFRRLRNEHNITIDHAGQQPPPKSSSKQPPRPSDGDTLPLITDDPDSKGKFSWEVIDSGAGNGEVGDIPWVLRGSPEDVAKARARVQKLLDQARKHSATGYLVLPDPRTYRYIIGTGGSKISEIRKRTGCKITVPRDGAKGEPIEIVGSREGVEEAKEIILEVVENGGAGNRNGD